MEFLKTKSVVTIIPEYMEPQLITANLNMLVTNARTSQLIPIQNTINDFYNTTKTFNDSINMADIVDLISLGLYPNVTSIYLESASLVLEVYGSTVSKNVYFKNEFVSVTSNDSVGSAVYSGSFLYNGNTIILKDKPTIFDENNFGVEGELHGHSGTTDVGVLGYVNYVSGYVTIDANVLPTSTTTSITAIPKYPDTIIIKNEFVLIANTTVRI